MTIDAKILTKILANQFQPYIKKSLMKIKWDFIPGMQGSFHICKLFHVINNINKRKDKNHMIILVDAEKNIWQHNTSIHEKTLNKVGLERTLNMMKAIYEKASQRGFFFSLSLPPPLKS